jgi:hypothetical protein
MQRKRLEQGLLRRRGRQPIQELLALIQIVVSAIEAPNDDVSEDLSGKEEPRACHRPVRRQQDERVAHDLTKLHRSSLHPGKGWCRPIERRCKWLVTWAGPEIAHQLERVGIGR